MCSKVHQHNIFWAKNELRTNGYGYLVDDWERLPGVTASWNAMLKKSSIFGPPGSNKNLGIGCMTPEMNNPPYFKRHIFVSWLEPPLSSIQSLQSIHLHIHKRYFFIYLRLQPTRWTLSSTGNLISTTTRWSIPHPPGNIQTQSRHLSVEFYIFSHNPSIHKMRCNLVKARRVTGKPVARATIKYTWLANEVTATDNTRACQTCVSFWRPR